MFWEGFGERGESNRPASLALSKTCPSSNSSFCLTPLSSSEVSPSAQPKPANLLGRPASNARGRRASPLRAAHERPPTFLQPKYRCKHSNVSLQLYSRRQVPPTNPNLFPLVRHPLPRSPKHHPALPLNLLLSPLPPHRASQLVHSPSEREPLHLGLILSARAPTADPHPSSHYYHVEPTSS